MMEKEHISISFFTRVNIRSEEFALGFYELLNRQGEVLVPQEFDGGELTGHKWVRFAPSDLTLATRVWTELGSMLMRRREPLESLITLNMHFLAGGRFNTASLSVEERYFATSDRPARFLELCLGLYNLLSPAYGFSHQVSDELETSTIMDPRYGKTVLPTSLGKGLPGVYWANFLGPEYVTMLERERLLSAPCFKRQELPDGGMLILTSQSPLEPSSPENRRAQAMLRRFLGEDLFYPSQSASTRVPVFKSDVPSHAGRNQLASHQAGAAERRAKAQNLIDNAVELASLLANDLAEEGIHLDHSVESLGALDQTLLQKREGGVEFDEFSLRMVAAYVGEVVKRDLDGQWVVDEMTGEAAIQLKGARIFPLARVTKFFDSEEPEAFGVILDIVDVVART